MEADRSQRNCCKYQILFSFFMISVSLPDVQLLTMPLPWQLYGGTNPLAPVAWFRTAHLRDVDGVEMAEMPTLSLQPECEQIAELVLASLLVVEQKYRMQSRRVVQKPYPVWMNGAVAS